MSTNNAPPLLGGGAPSGASASPPARPAPAAPTPNPNSPATSRPTQAAQTVPAAPPRPANPHQAAAAGSPPIPPNNPPATAAAGDPLPEFPSKHELMEKGLLSAITSERYIRELYLAYTETPESKDDGWDRLTSQLTRVFDSQQQLIKLIEQLAVRVGGLELTTGEIEKTTKIIFSYLPKR